MCCVLSCFSNVQPLAIPWTVAHQTPLSMGLSRKNSRVGCHVLLQGIFLTQGSNPHLLCVFFFFFNHWHHLGSEPQVHSEDFFRGHLSNNPENRLKWIKCRLLYKTEYSAIIYGIITENSTILQIPDNFFFFVFFCLKNTWVHSCLETLEKYRHYGHEFE